MLQKIRDNSQGFASKIIVGLMILVFGMWGVEYLVGAFVTSPTTLVINGVEISDAQVEAETQRKMRELIANMGENADTSQIDPALVREIAINELIQQELLTQAANNSGMSVSARNIDRQIASIPDFQVDGVFNNERAQLVLASGGFSPASFRAALARDTVLNQLLLAYSGSGFITPYELERLAALSEQTRDFRYLLINREAEAANITPTDAEIEAYYQSNTAQFMREEQVALEYLELNLDAMLDEVEVSDAEIQDRYEQELAAFQSQVERRASHILLEIPDAAQRDAVLAQAADLKARIDAGESFEDLAREFSVDGGSAQDGGDVGYTTGDTFVEPFEAALRDLEIGEVSGPVETEFGVHLIKLTDRSSTEFESLDMARERIATELRRVRAQSIYEERAEQLANLSFESLDLAEPASIMGLEVQTTGLFGRSGGAGIAANPAVINAAFDPEVLEDGLNSDVIRLSDSRSVVIRVTEHNPAAVRELSEVRGEVEVLLREQGVRELARSQGEALLQALQAGDDVAAQIEEQGLEWIEATDVGRDNRDLSPELLDRVFSMPHPGEGEVMARGFALESGDYAVIHLQAVTPGTIETLTEQERASLIGYVSQQTGTSTFNAYLASLQNRAEIER